MVASFSQRLDKSRIHRQHDGSESCEIDRGSRDDGSEDGRLSLDVDGALFASQTDGPPEHALQLDGNVERVLSWHVTQELRLIRNGLPILLRTQRRGVGMLDKLQVLDGVVLVVLKDDSLQRRSIDALEVARLARSRGMRGIVLKNHYDSTAGLAYLARKEAPGLEVFGGVDLNLTGELVLTTLTKEALPVVRYRTRDLTFLDPAPCRCGRTPVRIGRITGRTDDMLIVRGVNVFPSQVEHALTRLRGNRVSHQL